MKINALKHGCYHLLGGIFMKKTRDIRTITKKEFNIFVSNLIKDRYYDVFGVKEKGIRYVFSPLENASDL